MSEQAKSLDTLFDLLGGLQAAAQRSAPVPVAMPELGGTVHVMRLTAAEWLDPDGAASLPESATAAQRRAGGVARWVTDAQGKRLVNADNLPALDLFAALPWEAAHRILKAAGVVDEAEPKNA